MTPIQILQSIRDDSNVRFLDDTLDKAISELKELHNRSCSNCRSKNCSIKRTLIEDDEINPSYFSCNDWEKETK